MSWTIQSQEMNQDAKELVEEALNNLKTVQTEITVLWPRTPTSTSHDFVEDDSRTQILETIKTVQQSLELALGATIGPVEKKEYTP